MLNLILATVLVSTFFIAFKLFERLKLDTFQAIVVNYMTCVITGLIFVGQLDFISEIKVTSYWFLIAFCLACLFLFTFNLMAYSSQKIGISTTSVAAKISLILPVTFSIFLLNKNPEAFDALNYVGLVLVFLAIYFTSKKKEGSGHAFVKNRTFTVLLIFVCSGAIDVLVNVAQKFYVSGELTKIFPIVSFMIAAGLGMVILTSKVIMKKSKFSFKSILGGVLLGIPNYFSIYFLLRALEDFDNNGALIFPLSNIGVILLSIVGGVLIFHEKLSVLNRIGIVIAIVSLVCIAHQEIF